MWLDACVLVLIVFLAGFGARAGGAAAGLQLISLPVAYGGGLLAAWAFGPALAGQLGTTETIGGLVAGTVGFFVVQFILWLLTRAARRREESPTASSQALGALFGALRGALYALPVLWLAALSEGARMAGIQPALPDLSSAQLPAVGSEIIGFGARGLLDEEKPEGRFALHMVSAPTQTITGLEQVLHDKRLTGLQQDPGFWQDVERGAVGAALARPPARALVADRAFRAKLAGIGAVSPAAARDAHAFEVELALALAELGPKLAEIRKDPTLGTLLEDPTVRANVQNGNTLSLLGDPRFRSLVSQATRAR